MDLNDARVQALKLAQDKGLSVDDFNALWTLLVPTALKHGERRAAASIRAELTQAALRVEKTIGEFL